MDNETLQAVNALIFTREDAAFDRLEKDAAYEAVCAQQDKTEKMVEEYYQRFEKSERIAIRRHYEEETRKQNLELKAVYIQGLRDCFQLCAFLSGVSGEGRF